MPLDGSAAAQALSSRLPSMVTGAVRRTARMLRGGFLPIVVTGGSCCAAPTTGVTTMYSASAARRERRIGGDDGWRGMMPGYRHAVLDTPDADRVEISTSLHPLRYWPY